MKQWQLEEVEALRGFAVEWSDGDRLFLSRRNQLFELAAGSDVPRKIGTIPAGALRSLVAHFRLGQRLLRFLVFNLLPTAPGEFLVTFGKEIGVLRGDRYFPLQGIRQPTRVLRQGIVQAADGCVYWGEYIPNLQRQDIAVYRYRPGADRAEIAHLFPAGAVRHVHGIYRDPFDDLNTLWCLCGDLPHECQFLRTRDGFQTLEAVWEGDETWRAVSAQFTAKGIYYGSDAEFRENCLYRIDRADGSRQVIQTLDGPVYYSKTIGDHLFFATTAELCPSQTENVASLWCVDPDDRVERIFHAYKDFVQPDKKYGKKPLSALLFMHGTLHFPGGPGIDGETFLSLVGLTGYDHRVLRVFAG